MDNITRRGLIQKAVASVAAVGLAAIGIGQETKNKLKPGINVSQKDFAPLQKMSKTAFSDPGTIEQGTFAKGDFCAYINNVKIGTLESFTCSCSVETIIDESDEARALPCVSYKPGKRMIAGSMVFSQYDRHPILAAFSDQYKYYWQLPPFDMTIVGVDKKGHAARLVLYGTQICQSTYDWPQNDLGSAVGCSFVAREITPWGPVEGSGLSFVSTTSDPWTEVTPTIE